jgi:cell division protein FtsI (penicillin-binding protein 3)
MTTRGRRDRGDPGDPRRRAVTLLAVLAVLFGIVGLQLVRVQVIGAERYVRHGEAQRVRGIELAAGRGSIFDRNEYDLAISIPQRTVVADPRLVTDPDKTARVLVHVLDDADLDDLRARLTRDAAFVYVARGVSDEVANRVADLDLDGIWFIDEPQRFNPADDLAVALLGRVGTDNEGLSGLELRYDEALTGRPGELVLERDPEGRTIPAGRHRMDPAEPGEDLILTIDRNLQFEAERVLAEHVEATGSQAGTAIISDPRTGELFSVVNIETDADGKAIPSTNNLALTMPYEPGSVSKVVTLASAIEEGVVTPDTTLQVPYSLRVADHTFTDPFQHPTELYTVADILTKSSNVGTILIAQQLGEERVDDYLRAFGFGEPTVLDLQGEVGGHVPEPDDWSGTSIATIPLGQGISVTAMQMLFAFNTIANDGVYVPPKLVGTTVDADGERHPGASGSPRRVVSRATAAQMREMMTDVVAEGTGTAASIDGYAVAGKTGTARKASPDGGYDWPDGYRYTATFAGFMPADNPTLSVLVMLDEPQQASASASAAPAFAELSRHALRLLRLPPTTG